MSRPSWEGIVTPIHEGSTIVLTEEFQADSPIRRMGAEHVALVTVIPAIPSAASPHAPNLAAYKLSNFRHVICGGGQLTVDLVSRFERKFRSRSFHGYGLSEASCCSSMLPAETRTAEHRRWIGTHGFRPIGIPFPSMRWEFRIPKAWISMKVRRVKSSSAGTTSCSGTLRSQRNDETFRHGWLRTGDEGSSFSTKKAADILYHRSP